MRCSCTIGIWPRKMHLSTVSESSHQNIHRVRQARGTPERETTLARPLGKQNHATPPSAVTKFQIWARVERGEQREQRRLPGPRTPARPAGRFRVLVLDRKQNEQKEIYKINCILFSWCGEDVLLKLLLADKVLYLYFCINESPPPPKRCCRWRRYTQRR